MKLRRHRRSPWAFALPGLFVLAVSHPSRAEDPQPQARPGRPGPSSTSSTRCSRRPGRRTASSRPSRPPTRNSSAGPTSTSSGRIPNIREANDFLKSKDAGKRAKLVEYLLAHPDYPKNFATQWKVILLGRKNQAREVDAGALTAWLRRQFAENRPWNEMAFDLIDAKGSNKENGAVNFTLAHMAEGAVNLTSITTRVFLGQQIQCTQCHDHPSNDWKQSDFWGINAFYKGLKQRGGPDRRRRRDRDGRPLSS